MSRPRKPAALTLVPDAAPAPDTSTNTPAAAEAPVDRRTVEAAEGGKAADVRALALKHGPEAIAALVKIINGATSEAAKIAAANALLDRAYGKARPAAAAAEPPEETRLTVMFV